MAKLHELLDGDYATQTQTLVALTVAFLCWGYFQYLAAPNLSWIPRAGKAPGWFGFGLAEAKRDFRANGSKIIDEGYRKVSRISTLIQMELTHTCPCSIRTACF
jgi:hypothetical protein